jgi:hypothetical protein
MIGFETLPHPFLDLTPEEQITVLLVRDAEVKTDDRALPLLEAMGLVEYVVTTDPNAWHYRLTDGRGTVVAAYLGVLHDVREARRRAQQAHEPKWSIIISDYGVEAAEFKKRIEELPVNMPGTTL